MKVEDIVRVAYNKAVKSVQTSLYGRMIEVRQVGMESAKISLAGNFPTWRTSIILPYNDVWTLLTALL